MRDKRAKFVELANKRVNAAIKAVRLVSNLGNRSNYEYTEEDARKMMRALQKELDTAKAKFGDGSDSVGGEFRL
ncbi:hypothetical protein J8J14_22470 [Roseomonas sp. SSH11]|uniref:Uncharacterized protein n=1 Tax=Pararoseomonas baculiformis TaxID=2820812 RepID=A0ABS4AKX9_9PROT|nr:hypothetical protein [Pararoseomonas baculiformis]MBP0447529.1 hypothetical protein [Pararoseomonas baculiformis]